MDNGLSIKAIIRTDRHGLAAGRGESWWWESKSLEICAFSDDGILEHDEKAGVVLPLDLEATVLILKFGECILDVFRLELLWETGEIEDASDGCRKTGEIGGHG